MTFSYRRKSSDRDTTFYIPKVECFACNDSGIVTNGDNFINKFIPDYDRGPNGEIRGGQDLAIICHCKAAYGTDEKTGYRENNGQIREVQNIYGVYQALGCSLEKDKVRTIHLERKKGWEKTAKDINEIRNKRAKGEKVDTPYYIQIVKEELGNISNMFNFPR